MSPIPSLPIPPRTPELAALFDPHVPEPDSKTGCQFWQGTIMEMYGYGLFYVPSGTPNVRGTYYRAHRVAYAWKYGDPEDAIIDHLCHDPLVCPHSNQWCMHRRCVNPDHLASTTRGENVRRGLPGSPLWHPLGNSLKQICINGHEFTPENTYINPRGERQCRTCQRASQDRYAEANRNKINAKKRSQRERVVYESRPCPICGHPFTPERSTARYCKERDCVNERQRLNRLGRLGQ